MKASGILNAVLLSCLCGFCFFWIACDRSSDVPPRENRPDIPSVGGGERPDPTGEERDFKVELADATVRFDGGGVNLRFDRGGILVKIYPDGCRTLIDLDGRHSVELTLGEMSSDSIYRSAVLNLDGRKLETSEVRMKKQTAEAVWCHIKADGVAGGYMLVIP